MSAIRIPIFKDPQTHVRVQADMYVAGQLVKAGDVCLMQRSDADALRTIGRVEII
jgi:hypothetical protein